MLHHPRLTVVTGPMAAGKTEELLRRVERALIANVSVRVVVSARDTRYARGEVRSHGHRTTSAPVVVVETGLELLSIPEEVRLIAVDEAQFFDETLVAAVDALLRRGSSVVAAGLDMYSTGDPYGVMPALLAKAHDVVKLRAVCMRCGDDATHTHRLAQSDAPTLVGGLREYEARCYPCWLRGKSQAGS